MPIAWIQALLGGVFIGIAVSLMLYWNGRVTGISSIIHGSFQAPRGDRAWRVMFVLGLVSGGLLIKMLHPELLQSQLASPLWTVPLAGFLVGFGTILGSGCTSGHGVCGISRFSPRSLAATLCFMASGVVAVAVFKKLGVLP